jgi:hypothetical protein
MDGDFYQSAGRIVIWPLRPVTIKFERDGKEVTWHAEPGNLILRNSRPLSPAERQYVELHGLWPEPKHATIGSLFDDPDALETALRREVRHIPEALIGSADMIRGHLVVRSGALDRALSQAQRREIYAQYVGVINRAKELKRIQDRIELGFTTAYRRLAKWIAELEAVKLDGDKVIRIGQAAADQWPYLRRVATIDPYRRWIMEPSVFVLRKLPGGYDQETILFYLTRAQSALQKGWKGRRVADAEVRQARQRARRMEQ